MASAAVLRTYRGRGGHEGEPAGIAMMSSAHVVKDGYQGAVSALLPFLVPTRRYARSHVNAHSEAVQAFYHRVCSRHVTSPPRPLSRCGPMNTVLHSL